MTRNIFVLVLIALATSYVDLARAQTLKTYGLKLAVTSADQKFDYTYFSAPESKRRVGLNAALFAEWFDYPHFSIITQLEYCQRGRGWRFVITDETGPASARYVTNYTRIDYLSVPVFGKMRFNAEPVIPYVILGPRFDLVLLKRFDNQGFNSVYDNFSNTMGVSMGIGVESSTFLPFHASIEARYNLDLLDSYSTQYLKVSNNSFDLWLGISI